MAPVELLVSTDLVEVRHISFFFGELLHKLLIKFISFLFLLHVQETPWGTVLSVLSVCYHADNDPKSGQNSRCKEVLSRRHVYKHDFETDEESEDANQNVLGQHQAADSENIMLRMNTKGVPKL